ncbi:MAG: thioredoxin domain-containing protein [Bifidobacteriaceae bacterium]|jgi:protein-disulfide isomerase|nr:thioredoxin domain-containing protein [Bifidobacteriaceae bacterium]
MANKKNQSGKAKTAGTSREAARAEAERLKAAQAAKERRVKLIAISAAVVVVIAAVVAVVFVIREANKSNFADVPKPVGGNEAGVIVIGQDLAAGGTPAEGDEVVVLRMYSDYICPGCGSVERRLGSKLEELTADGKIKLEIAPVPFLDYMSNGTQYSTRATNAAMTVANYAPDKFMAFHAKLFETGIQPEENTDGLSDERLVELAQEVGVPEDVAAKFAAMEFIRWLDYSVQEARAQPVEGTPSMWIGKSDSDLTLIDNPSSINLDEAIADVLAGNDPNKE